jgi:serine/threonine protein kinase
MLYMVTPWMAFGTIMDYLKAYGQYYSVRGCVSTLCFLIISLDSLDSDFIHFQVLEIAEGIEYLQSKNITHGDLRGVNLLAVMSSYGV